MRSKNNKQTSGFISDVCYIHRLSMKYIIMLIISLMHLNVSAQLSISAYRKAEIERFMEKVNSVKEFKQVAYTLQMTVGEMSDYPIITPVKNPVISSGYGMRKHPISKVRKWHKGIDLAKAKSTPVYATGTGIVSRKGYDSGYGLFVEIKHSGGFRTLYAHLSKAMVNKGDLVIIGTQIALVGNTGTSTGNHLHYEVRKDKRILNPTEWIYCLYDMLKDE